MLDFCFSNIIGKIGFGLFEWLKDGLQTDSPTLFFLSLYLGACYFTKENLQLFFILILMGIQTRILRRHWLPKYPVFFKVSYQIQWNAITSTPNQHSNYYIQIRKQIFTANSF